MRRAWLTAAAVIALAAPAQAQVDGEKFTINLCTGGEGGVYYKAGLLIQENMKHSNDVNINVVKTRGSWDNMHRLSEGECHAAISQPDAYMLWNARNGADAMSLFRVSELHKEYVHGFCRKDTEIEDIGDMQLEDGRSIMVGRQGSGSWVTWNYWAESDDDFDRVAQMNIGGRLGLARLANGGENAPDCYIYIVGLGSSNVQMMDQTYADRVNLVSVYDNDFDDIDDSTGSQLYVEDEIPAGTYKNFQSGWFTAVDTYSMRAAVYLNEQAFDGTYSAIDEFIGAVEQTRPRILDEAGE